MMLYPKKEKNIKIIKTCNNVAQRERLQKVLLVFNWAWKSHKIRIHFSAYTNWVSNHPYIHIYRYTSSYINYTLSARPEQRCINEWSKRNWMQHTHTHRDRHAILCICLTLVSISISITISIGANYVTCQSKRVRRDCKCEKKHIHLEVCIELL